MTKAPRHNISYPKDKRTTQLMLAVFPIGMLGAIALIYFVLWMAEHKKEIIQFLNF